MGYLKKSCWTTEVISLSILVRTSREPIFWCLSLTKTYQWGDDFGMKRRRKCAPPYPWNSLLPSVEYKWVQWGGGGGDVQYSPPRACLGFPPSTRKRRLGPEQFLSGSPHPAYPPPPGGKLENYQTPSRGTSNNYRSRCYKTLRFKKNRPPLVVFTERFQMRRTRIIGTVTHAIPVQYKRKWNFLKPRKYSKHMKTFFFVFSVVSTLSE
jgi:hypothetical protein